MKIKSFFPELLLLLFVVLYVFLMLFNTHYSPIEDHAYLSTLDKGKFLFWFDGGLKSAGRFMLLYGQDFNLMNILCKNGQKPFTFYIILSIEYILGIVFLYVNLLISVNKEKRYLSVFLLLFFSLSMSMTTAFFRLTYVERNIFLFFSAAIFFYYQFNKSNKLIYLIAGIVCANLSLYFKEIAFVSIGAWGAFYLIFNLITKTKRNKFNFLLIISSLLYVLGYIILVLPYIKKRYGLNMLSFFENFIKSLVEFTIGDPFLILVLSTVFFYRVFVYVSGKNRAINPYYDSLLMAALAYMSGFFVLRMTYVQSYMLPVYAFALPAIMYYLFHENYIKKPLFKVVVTLALLIQLLNLPLGINQIFFHKQNNQNFQRSMEKMSNEIQTNRGKKLKLFVLGGRDIGSEAIVSVGTNLLDKGCDPKKFDMLTSESLRDPNYALIDSLSPFTVFKDTLARFPSHGDYIIYTPYTLFTTKDTITQNTELILTTESFFLPDVSIKTVLRWLILQTPYKELIRNQKTIVDANYYIFKKK